MITDVRPFSDLILVVSGGNEHASAGVGTIDVDGYILTRYWVPSLKVIVISVHDFTDVKASVVVHPDGYAYGTDYNNPLALTRLGKAADKIETIPSIQRLTEQARQL